MRGGVGNFGFNSFNFMTFVLLTLNAVANVNNNINNNNNNNVDINYNTINQDSNSVISNSENMNMVMAMILPVPGKRTLELFNRCASTILVIVRDSLGKDLKILAFANSGDDGEITRTVAHHVSKRCAGSQISLTDLVKLEVFDQVRLGDDDHHHERKLVSISRCVTWWGTPAKTGENQILLKCFLAS